MTNNKQDHIGEANKMVTAVEWLIDELIKNHGIQANLYSEFEQAKEMEKERMIGFASWLAKSEWMSIWVVDKWIWECQKENSNTNYKTDKELFDIYYNETYGGEQ
jgi:hypothetical protein